MLLARWRRLLRTQGCQQSRIHPGVKRLEQLRVRGASRHLALWLQRFEVDEVAARDFLAGLWHSHLSLQQYLGGLPKSSGSPRMAGEPDRTPDGPESLTGGLSGHPAAAGAADPAVLAPSAPCRTDSVG